MSELDQKPYNTPRNLDQDAWFLYQTTSIEYYELCANLCEAFANLYNALLTGHGLHGAARLDHWVSRYLTHAYNVRRGIEFIKHGRDYMPMIDFLNAPAADYRGLVEQPLGWMEEEERERWDQTFARMSHACAVGSETLKNNQWAGRYWLERHLHDRQLVDRDDSHKGDLAEDIQLLGKHALLMLPATYPHHPVDTTLSVKPGMPCPRSGVWVPIQWLQGAQDVSLAFCVEGQPMQPAYQLYWGKPYDMWADFPLPGEANKETQLTTLLETKAVDTTWHFVSQPADPMPSAINLHLRCEAGQPCPKSGYWMTPAKSGSRRYFQQGAPMPEVVSDYGSTIWQWDSDQSGPKL